MHTQSSPHPLRRFLVLAAMFVVLALGVPFGVGFFGTLLRAANVAQPELASWLLSIAFWCAAIYLVWRLVRLRH